MILAVIAELKLAATYLVPGLWPALILAVGSVLAGVMRAMHLLGIAPLPGSEWPFVLNVLFWSGVLATWIGAGVGLKKLLGRQPSLNEILSGLVSTKSLEAYKEEQRLRCVGLEKQISDARHSFDERANTDLARTLQTFKEVFDRGEQRDKDVGRLRDTIARLQERTETHIRKLDQYDTKMDNLLREVSKAAARGVREAQQ
jgi:hypothetical protein